MFILEDYTLRISLESSFPWNWCSSSNCLWNQLILLFMACELFTTISWYQKVLFLARSQISFGGWFSIGHTISGLEFLVMSSNSFCSSLWKVIASRSILGYFSHSKLFMWPTSTLFYNTHSIFLFILLANIVGIV
jgi:hypothetical protein